MPICTRCAELYVSSPTNRLCPRCIGILNPPEIPIVKDEEWNFAQAKANQDLCAILGRIPKGPWYGHPPEVREFGYFHYYINQGKHTYLLRKKFWSELTPEEQRKVETVDSLSALTIRNDFRARREEQEKQESEQR
jgi:hypothetical protein